MPQTSQMFSSISAMAVKAMPMVAVAVVSVMAAKSIAGQYRIEGIGSALNYFGAVGGALNRAFGRGPKETTAQGITGSFGADGFTGQAYSEWMKKGGWLRTDKRGSDSSVIDAAVASQLNATYKAIKDSTAQFAAALGAPADVVAGYTKQIKLALTGDEGKDQQALAALFGQMGDELAARVVPGIQSFIREGETAAMTLQRLAAEFQAVGRTMDVLGTVSKMSLEARDRLVQLAGGLESFATQADYFAANFLTEAQQLAPVQKMVTEQLAALGYAGVATVAQFRDAVLGLAQSGALASAEGAKTYAALMALAPAFKQVADAANQVEAMLADTLRSAAGAAFDTLDASISTRKADLQKAFDDVMSKFDKRIQASTDRIDSLQSLRSTLGGAVGMGVQADIARQQAQAQLGAALAIAKASGILPSAESLQDAMRVVQQDASNQFASAVDFQRDQLRTANQITELAKFTDVQLTVEERTLQSLLDQKTMIQSAYAAEILRLDGILASAQGQLDAINGNTTAVLSLKAGFEKFAGSISAALGNTTIGGQSSVTTVTQIEALYNSVLGRASDAEGLKFWTEAMRTGHSLDEIERGFRDSPGYKALQAGKAVQQSALSADGSALLSELQTLNTRMGKMETSMNETAKSTRQYADQFDSVSGGGNTLATQVYRNVQVSA